MYRYIAYCVLMIYLTLSTGITQDRPEGFRSPAKSGSEPRKLTPEEISPNLNYYSMDPLYDPNAVLGWAKERIEEKINRGMLALNAGDGKVYLGWRFSKAIWKMSPSTFIALPPEVRQSSSPPIL